MPPKTKICSAWKYFTKTERGGQCILCFNEIITNGNTTNLNNHLKRKHADKLSANDEHSVKKQSTDCAAEICIDLCQLDKTSQGKSQESKKLSQTGKPIKNCIQPEIDKSLKKLKSYEGGGDKAGQIMNAIMFMIAKDNMPYATVEKEGFKYLMRVLAPRYELPGRKTITKNCDDKYEILSQLKKEELSTVSSIALTSDVWTDTMNTKSYLGLTAHYILHGDVTLVTIGVMELSDSHTAQHLTKWLLDMCTKWRIEVDRIVAVVTDNAANIVKAAKDAFGSNKHIPCFAHTLNLIAIEIVEKNDDVNNLCDKVKKIVTFFKQCVNASDELRKLEKLTLKQSVCTRWNSTYSMLERFIALSESIGRILLKFPKAPSMLSALELQLAKEVISVLSPLEKITKELCGELYVTASKVIPIINCLKQQMFLLTLDLTSDVSIFLNQALLKEIDKRFHKVEFQHSLAIASILDPRFKKLHFNEPLAYSKAIQWISNAMYNEIGRNIDSDKENVISLPKSSHVNDLWSFHETLASTAITNLMNTSDEMPTDLKHI